MKKIIIEDFKKIIKIFNNNELKKHLEYEKKWKDLKILNKIFKKYEKLIKK